LARIIRKYFYAFSVLLSGATVILGWLAAKNYRRDLYSGVLKSKIFVKRIYLTVDVRIVSAAETATTAQHEQTNFTDWAPCFQQRMSELHPLLERDEHAPHSVGVHTFFLSSD
jgi:hypothetical protein